MIHSILFMDPGGNLVYSWRSQKERIIKREENMVASLIKTLIDFGKETISAPQRIDFGEYAINFSLMETEKGDYWIATLSDADDYPKATKKTLKEIINRVKQLIMAMSFKDGFTFKNEELFTYIDQEVSELIQNQRKALEPIRNDPLKSFLLATCVMLPLFIGLDFGRYHFIVWINGVVGSDLVMIGLYLFSWLALPFFGFIGGIIAGKRKSGAFAAYVGYLFAPLHYTFIGAPWVFIYYAFTYSGFGAIAGITGWFGGKFLSERRLLPPQNTSSQEKKVKKQK